MGGTPTKEECTEAGYGIELTELLGARRGSVVGQAEESTSVHSSSGFHLLEFAGEGTTGAFMLGLGTGVLIAALVATAQRRAGWCSPKQAKLARETRQEVAQLAQQLQSSTGATAASPPPPACPPTLGSPAVLPPWPGQAPQPLPGPTSQWPAWPPWALPQAARSPAPALAWSSTWAPPAPRDELGDLITELRHVRLSERERRASMRARQHYAELARDRFQELPRQQRPDGAGGAAAPGLPPPAQQRGAVPRDALI